MTNQDIIDAIEAACPPQIQESWDNSGWQAGYPDDVCEGVLICLDITPEIIHEARALGCNLIITHHPLLFRGIKQVTGRNRVEDCLAKVLAMGISVYSAHTSADCAAEGVSHRLAQILGLHDITPLCPNGLGAIGNLPKPIDKYLFIRDIKQRLNLPMIRHSQLAKVPFNEITRVAVCGGAGADLITDAIAQNAQILITADCKHNQFLDYANRIILADAGHFETELCTKDIFYEIITKKIPNFAVYKSTVEQNPVEYS